MQTVVSPFRLKPHADDMIRMGVVDMDRYLASDPKIMVVTKGILPCVEGIVSSSWRECAQGKHFVVQRDLAVHRLELMCRGILNGFPPWQELVGGAAKGASKDVLWQVAYVSVPRFRDATLYRRVSIRERYLGLSRLVRGHIETYKPDIVLFAGTLELFGEGLGLGIGMGSSLMEQMVGGETRIYIGAPDLEVRSSGLRYYEGIRSSMNALSMSGVW